MSCSVSLYSLSLSSLRSLLSTWCNPYSLVLIFCLPTNIHPCLFEKNSSLSNSPSTPTGPGADSPTVIGQVPWTGLWARESWSKAENRTCLTSSERALGWGRPSGLQGCAQTQSLDTGTDWVLSGSTDCVVHIVPLTQDQTKLSETCSKYVERGR